MINSGDTDKGVRLRGRNVMRRLSATKQYHRMMDRKRAELKELPKKKKVREFHLPKLNFKAQHYYEMVDLKWETPMGPYSLRTRQSLRYTP